MNQIKSIRELDSEKQLRTVGQIIKGINETLNKLEDKIDEKNGIEKEEVKLEKKQTFHDKFIKDLKDNTPHSGQFDEDI